MPNLSDLLSSLPSSSQPALPPACPTLQNPFANFDPGFPPTRNKNGAIRKPHDRRKLFRELLPESEGGKQCSRCRDFLSLESFPKSSCHAGGRGNCCRECTRLYRNEHAYQIKKKNLALFEKKRDQLRAQALEWRKANPEIIILSGARRRARQLGVPCTITLEDIKIPEFCPVFGFPLIRNLTGKRFTCAAYNSPSLDRIVPKLGYVPGNVQVISHKANMMKWSRTPEGWEPFARWILSILEANRAVENSPIASADTP